MLNLMRKNTKIILWILLILIIPPFIFWGVGSAMKGNKNPVIGTVFGKKIRLSDFVQQTYVIQANMKLAGQRPRNLYDVEGITWHRIVMLEEAKRQNILVNDSELAHAISRIFTIKGSFNQQYYKDVVTRTLNMSIIDFEKHLKDSLRIDKLTTMIENTVKLVPQEVKDYFHSENDQLEIAYVLLDSDKYIKDVEIKDNLLNDFYTKNSEKYRIGEKRKGTYIKIDKAAFLNDISVSEKEVETYYDSNKEDFRNDDDTLKPLDLVRDTIIQDIKLEKAAQKQHNVTEKIFYDIVEEKKLSDIAEKFNYDIHQLDFSGQNDGLAGIEKSEIITQNLFSTPLGEISDPIEVDSTYYFIQPDEESPSYIPSLEETIETVKIDFANNEAFTLARKKAEELKVLLDKQDTLTPEDFEKACHNQGLSVITPPAFSRNKLNLDFSDIYQLKVAAMNLPRNTVSNVIDLSSGPALLIVTNKTAAPAEEFEKEKELYTEKLLRKKKEIVLSEWYRDLLKECKISSALSQIAAQQQKKQ